MKQISELIKPIQKQLDSPKTEDEKKQAIQQILYKMSRNWKVQ